MSWYNQNSNNGSKIDSPQTPKPKQENQVQVPSSSPILINSSPNSTKSSSYQNNQQPSLSAKMEKDKLQSIEKARQKVRDQPNFPLIRKRFFYVSESDIFKAFYTNRGALRDITAYLEKNFPYSEYTKNQKEMEEKKRQQEEQSKQKLLDEQFKRKYEASLKKKDESDDDSLSDTDPFADYKPNVHKPTNTNVKNGDDEDDDLPTRSKGKARVKIEDLSPVKENNNSSTKVEIKSKQSILNKYRNPLPKPQPSLSSFGRLDSLSDTKRRKLVRGSELDRSNSGSVSPIPAPSSLSAKFTYQEGPGGNLSNNSSFSQLDELEASERRLAENLKKARLQKQQLHFNVQPKSFQKSSNKVINISDDEGMLEDDNASDSMSDADLDADSYDGITSIDSKILEFINSAPIDDLCEISAIDPDTAELVIQQRPFNTIYEISENDFTSEPVNKSSRKKKLGLRMIEQTEQSLKGYKAIDSLIKKCAEYGDIISNQMKEWGVTATGESGELDIVDLDPIDGDDETERLEKNEDDDDDVMIVKKKGLKYIKHKPALLDDDITLNNYQQAGINWINLLYSNKLSCILADEMGLGKTCQVIAFIAHLKEVNEKFPHLIVVPASTIENWIREFNKFCPEIKVQAYYGSQKEREELRYELQDRNYEVLVTTYSMACGSPQDAKFLKNQNFNVIVYDEGHLLKNSQSERYNKLMRLKGNFRLLLTGTPLQNNLKELISLLAFILPHVFNEKKEDLVGIFKQKANAISDNKKTPSKEYNPLLSMQAIKNAKTMMTPFVLRRRKDQVLQHLPAKSHEIIRCQLTPDQSKLYFDCLEKGRSIRIEREKRKTMTQQEVVKLNKSNPIPTSSNVLMQLRKAALHPLLFRQQYTDDKLKKMAKAIMNEPEYVEANETFIFEDMQVMSDFELNNLCNRFHHTLSRWKLNEDLFLDSGKIKQLEKILDTIINKKKEKVLFFSLFTQMLDIMEKVLSIFNYKFVRLDGATKVEERQETIDLFYEDPDIPIFLLSTKAGGFGINLIAANNVIIFDQSFNPHDDKQAEDRAHRVGQTKEVVVYKLITDKTVEQNMLMVAENKLQLDYSMSNDESNGGNNNSNNNKFEESAASIFEKILYQDDK
ncbi:FUN30 [Candida pseudojiufengensis]|uniref:FUN30 n=1 Tax=Candida pseudojiufengensis TaxID=497109 RepID=UPI0022245B20|nr:FUN30 [Candida pseudojiufengensis]KAI5962672.1 FUN30 [Candida pseudojiufengensis]